MNLIERASSQLLKIKIYSRTYRYVPVQFSIDLYRHFFDDNRLQSYSCKYACYGRKGIKAMELDVFNSIPHVILIYKCKKNSRSTVAPVPNYM